jgi:hypothetical protein
MSAPSAAPDPGPPIADTEEKKAIVEQLGPARAAFAASDGSFRRAQALRAARQAHVLALEALFFALPSDRQPPNERKIEAARKDLDQALAELASLGAEVRRTP